MNVLIRDLPDDVHAALQRRAERRGRPLQQCLAGELRRLDAASGAMRELAARSNGYHRVPPTDALIAAAAEHGGFAVLHRDAHFDRLAEVLSFQSVELPVP